MQALFSNSSCCLVISFVWVAWMAFWKSRRFSTHVQQKLHQCVRWELPIKLNDTVVLEDIQAAHLFQTWLDSRSIIFYPKMGSLKLNRLESNQSIISTNWCIQKQKSYDCVCIVRKLVLAVLFRRDVISKLIPSFFATLESFWESTIPKPMSLFSRTWAVSWVFTMSSLTNEWLFCKVIFCQNKDWSVKTVSRTTASTGKSPVGKLALSGFLKETYKDLFHKQTRDEISVWCFGLNTTEICYKDQLFNNLLLCL